MSTAAPSPARGASAPRAFVLLAVEAALDLVRRRLALVVTLVLLLAVAAANTCTDFSAGDVRFNDRPLDPAIVAGFVAPTLFAYQALVVLLVAGLVAADHLARPLGDGSAVAWLARPVSRGVYACARLAGACAVSLALAALVLGATTALLYARHAVAPGPALAGGIATALGALVVASLAMSASLWIGRTPLVLLLSLAVPLQFGANVAGVLLAWVHPDLELPGVLQLLDRFGPPLGTAVFAAVSAWNPHVDAGGLLAQMFARLLLWVAGGVALLVAAFRRIEIDA
jgi:hypothetical protein